MANPWPQTHHRYLKHPPDTQGTLGYQTSSGPSHRCIVWTPHEAGMRAYAMACTTTPSETLTTMKQLLHHDELNQTLPKAKHTSDHNSTIPHS